MLFKKLLTFLFGVFCAFLTNHNMSAHMAPSLPKPHLYVYEDAGASPTCVEQTLRLLTLLLGNDYEIATLDAQALIKGDWKAHTALFVMPGGADLPYCKKLDGEGNKQIRSYVEAGGSFLGICAGAYYACNDISFSHNGEVIIEGERELKFFSGTAVGPLVPYDPDSNSGVRAFQVRVDMEAFSGEVYVFFNGGPYFKHANEYETVSLLGHYNETALENKPALLYVPIGKGHVVLSSFHFEYDPHTLDPKDEHLRNVLPRLKEPIHEFKRKQLALAILKKLGLEPQAD